MKKFAPIALAVVASVAFAACRPQTDTAMSTPETATTDQAMMTNDTLPVDEEAVGQGSPAPKVAAGTGVMVGGSLMTPDKDIVTNAMNASNVTTLVSAVKAAGLVETLQGEGPYTVFAPTNTAFEKLPAGTVEGLLKPEKKAELTKILNYHVVAGRYTTGDLKDGMKLKTVQGQQLAITVKDGQVMVNGTAMVETADVISSNGITHVIDTVLMPK